MVTLRNLRHFIVLTEELHFTRAAERASISQQGFSKSIKELETSIGAPLFDRTSRGVVLSTVGRCLVEPVRDALELIDSGLAEARALSGRLAESLDVGMVPSGGAGELMMCILDAFRVEHPEIRVRLHEGAWDDPSGGVRDGLVDIAFVRLPVDTDGLVIRELFGEPLNLCVSSRHPLAERSEVTLEEAVAEPLVLATKSTPERDHFWLLCEQRGAMPRVTATAGSLLEEIETVATGQASTFLPASAARVVNHSGARFLPIIGGPVSTVALAWRAERLSISMRAFVDVVDHVLSTETQLMAALVAGRPLA